jgi:hypothetical protein
LRERLLPEARSLFVSNEAVAALTRARLIPRENEALWIVGYEQPSIIFLTRTWVRLVEIGDVAETPIHAGDAMMIEGRVLSETESALATRGLVFDSAEAPARGMAIGRGEYMTLYIGRVSELVSGEPAAVRPQNP